MCKLSIQPVWLFLCFLLLGCQQQSEDGLVLDTTFSGSLTIQAPSSADAGDPVSIEMVADVADGTMGTLVAIGSFGPLIYPVTFAEGVGRVEMPASDTQRSGHFLLVGRIGEQEATAEMTLLPGPPIEPLKPLVGARSITADAEHWAMIVVIPFDDLDNPVAEGTPIETRALHPGQRLEEETIMVEHLLAWKRVWSGTKAGKTTIAVQSGAVFGSESELLEVPGWPVPFTLSMAVDNAPADGRQLLTITSDVIVDKFDNPMPDGTKVNFYVEDITGEVRQIPTFTVDGVAETTLQAPDIEGNIKIWGTVFGIESTPTQMTFTPGPAIETFPVAIQVAPHMGAVELTAGPVLGNLSQYVPDGTAVLFRYTGPDNRTRLVRGAVEAGYATAEIRLAQLVPGEYIVKASAGSGEGNGQFTVMEPLSP